MYIHAASNILTENIVLMYLIICCALLFWRGSSLLQVHWCSTPLVLRDHLRNTHIQLTPDSCFMWPLLRLMGRCVVRQQRAAQCANMLLQRLRDPTETVKRQKRITTSSVHFLSRDDKYAVMIENTMTWKINRTFHYWWLFFFFFYFIEK